MTNRRFSLTWGLSFFLFFLALCGMKAVAEQDVRSLKKDAKTQVNAKTVLSTDLQAFLDEIAKKEEWKTADVMELVPRLQLFWKELADFQHLPNQEALNGKFPAKDHTAQVLDLYYRYAIHRAFQAVAKDIEKMNGWNSDARLVLLAASCARHLDSGNFARQLELGRRLVELEPGNMKFRESLAWLEKQLGKNKTAVQSRQQVPSAHEQSAH